MLHAEVKRKEKEPMPESPPTFYIYQIVNTVNTKVYVGSTIYKDERWRQHLRAARYPKQWHHPLYRDMYEYGIDKFSMEILDERQEGHQLSVEYYWINLLGCMYPNGYNVDILGYPKIRLKLALKHLTDMT